MTGLLVLGAWSLGILTVHRRFFMPYAAPVLWSAAQIAAVLLVAQREGAPHARLAFAIAWGAVAGAGLQLAVMAWPLRSLIGALRPTLDVRDPSLREAAATLPSALLGRGVLQLSGLVDTALVGLLGSGAIATVNYAQTLYLLPMALLGTGEAAAALPELAERAGDGSEEAKASIVASLGRTLTRVFALGLGATVALGVTLLLRGGRFDGGSAADVARALSTYALGLSANAASRVLAAASFALGDTARPARFATIRVVASTAGSIALMGSFGVSGVIAGAVVAAWIELALLARAVHDRLGATGLAAVPFARILGACALTAGAGLGARHGLTKATLHPLTASAIVLVAGGATFVLAIGATGVLPIGALLRRARRR
jgi:putative peptidoglycan lipid II flippase